MLPTLRAVVALGGSAQGKEITTQVLDEIDRIDWARSYAKLGGALESPRRGLYILTPLGKEILNLEATAALERLRVLDRAVKAARAQNRQTVPESEDPVEDEAGEDTAWRDVLLNRLHRLSPEGFEEFVMYLLRSFGLELTRVGGTGDQGIDGIGTAPISPVLTSRVAVQVKRHDPTSSISREVVALFQRDAAAAGAERAVLVTLGRFSEPARQAAITTTPTVDLIDGDKLCDLVREKEIGLRIVPQVQEEWFGRFDS